MRNLSKLFLAASLICTLGAFGCASAPQHEQTDSAEDNAVNQTSGRADGADVVWTDGTGVSWSKAMNRVHLVALKEDPDEDGGICGGGTINAVGTTLGAVLAKYYYTPGNGDASEERSISLKYARINGVLTYRLSINRSGYTIVAPNENGEAQTGEFYENSIIIDFPALSGDPAPVEGTVQCAG